MTALSVNVNKVAWLRNARMGARPDVVAMARLAVDSGADGITVHPRPDQRHIRPDDVRQLAKAGLGVELNLEGNPFSGATGDGYPGFLSLAEEVSPAQVTLVPDADEQLTSDHGWDVAASAERLAPVVQRLRALGCRVSLFVDPGCRDLALVRELGAHRVELYTEAFAVAHAARPRAPERYREVLSRYVDTAADARDVGLGLNAGHDLNLDNLTDLCAAIPAIVEVSIGQALVADALVFGLADTVHRYRDALVAAQPH